MTAYYVQRMTKNDYHTMMRGEYGFHVENLTIEAETPEEAKKIAAKDGYMVNDLVLNVEEWEAERKVRREKAAQNLKNRKAANKKRRESEIAKAEALGMTLKEYRADKARRGQITRLRNEIEDLERELKKKRAYLKKLEG